MRADNMLYKVTLDVALSPNGRPGDDHMIATYLSRTPVTAADMTAVFGPHQDDVSMVVRRATMLTEVEVSEIRKGWETHKGTVPRLEAIDALDAAAAYTNRWAQVGAARDAAGNAVTQSGFGGYELIQSFAEAAAAASIRGLRREKCMFTFDHYRQLSAPLIAAGLMDDDGTVSFNPK